MSGLVEKFAQEVGWMIARNNVVVEGTSDVVFLRRASELHAAARGRAVLDADFAVVPAGLRDDGGVEGVNRRLNLMRQLTDADRDETGALRYRFVGLLDNDEAGRGALAIASKFDRRIEPYHDLFLLHPVMPTLAIGADRRMAIALANVAFRQLDWEIEDLCSQRILAQFERDNPNAILSRMERGGKVHREFLKAAKPELRQFFTETATIADAGGFLELLKIMRSYLGLDHTFIVP